MSEVQVKHRIAVQVTVVVYWAQFQIKMEEIGGRGDCGLVC